MIDRNKIIIDYWNIISDSNVSNIGEIPEDKLDLITVSSTDSLLKPIVCDLRKKGLTRGQIATKYKTNVKKIGYCD